MTLELRQITRDEIVAWQSAVAIGFMSLPDPATHEIAEAIFDHRRTLATFETGKMVGTYVSFPTTVSMPGGGVIDANAISGVTVMPTHRKQGILRTAITADLSSAKERGEPVALLLASEFPIYGRFGFGVASEYSQFEIETRGITFLREPDGGSVEIMSASEALPLCKQVFARARLSAAGAIDRHDVIWRRTLGLMDDRAEWKFKGFIAVTRNVAGEPDGYLRYTGGDQWVNDRPQVQLEVDEFVAATNEAHLRLWHYLCTMAWVAKVKTTESAVDDDIRLCVADQRMIHQASRLDHTWARALDVSKLLTGRTYEVADAVTIEVLDAMGFANGTVRLDASPEGSTCVPSTAAPDVTMAVNELSALTFGGTSATALHRVGRIAEHRSGSSARMDRLFRADRAPWNPTRF